jgi:hypothetical protein
MSTKKVYPGRLGKRTPRRMLLESADRTYIEAGGFDNWLRAYHQELFSELLGHYGISREDPQRWHELAYCLAKDHVPAFAFAARPGPAPKRHTIRPTALPKLILSVWDLLGDASRGRHASGLPPNKKFTPEFREALLRLVTQLRTKSRQSERQILEDLLRGWFRQRNLRWTRHGPATVHTLQNQLSLARRERLTSR